MKTSLLVIFGVWFISVVQGQTRVIRTSIYFGGGSYVIDREQIEELYRLIDAIPDLQHYQISITSHTDNIGGREYNEWLSGKRSEAVWQQMLDKNIPKDKVFIKDFGQENPVYNNNSNAGRRMNRRVDIIFSPLNM